MKTKFLSIFMVIVILLSTMTICAFASDDQTIPAGYVPIYDKDDLMLVHSNPSASYILMADIIFDESDFDKTYNDGMGWIPFENFSGTFDGNGHKIANLKITGNQSTVGLFATLSGSAIVKNLTLENVYINVSGNCVGGICGIIQMNKKSSNYVISNCRVSGIVSGGDYVGGLCGYAGIEVTEYCYLFDKSCNLASVNGSKYVGGLLGYHRGYAYYLGYAGARSSNSFIQLSMNMGSVHASTYAGGILGYAYEPQDGGSYGTNYSYLTIRDCFNNGSVSASNRVGGIIGETYCSKNNSQVTLTNIYNSGTVSSSSNEYLGAICGVKTLNASGVYYLNSCVSGASTVIGESLSADKLKIKSMGSNWTTTGNKNYPYPEIIGVDMIFELTGFVYVDGVFEQGSTLEVNLSDVNPEFASTRIEWIIDDSVVGEGTTYQISEEDAGKKIFVIVYGEDDCFGVLTSQTYKIADPIPNVEEPEIPNEDNEKPNEDNEKPNDEPETPNKDDKEENSSTSNSTTQSNSLWEIISDLFKTLSKLFELLTKLFNILS